MTTQTGSAHSLEQAVCSIFLKVAASIWPRERAITISFTAIGMLTHTFCHLTTWEVHKEILSLINQMATRAIGFMRSQASLESAGPRS